MESRWMPSALPPSVAEQLFLQELDLARSNPAAYGQSIGLDLSNVAPSQPLAFNGDLIQAAFLHSQDMSVQGYFAHVTPQGVDPGQRMTNAGFNWISWGESIAGGTAYPGPADALQGLIIDSGIPDLGHRIQLLAMQPQFQTQNQVGIGVLQGSSGPLVDYYTIDTADNAIPQTFLTGVVFHDHNGNGQYAMNEGVAGATITVSGIGSFPTWSTGGYSIPVSPGTYTVTASGGDLTAPITRIVTVGASNVQVNFSPEDDAFVQHVYQSVLGRPASNTDLGNWTAVLQGWGGPNAVVVGIENAAEGRKRLVDSWYVTYLGRPAQGGEEQGWVQYLLQGASETSVLSAILGSQEFYNRAGTLESNGTADQRYIEALYSVLLNRNPSNSDLSAWTGVLTPVDRGTIVNTFLSTFEYRADVVRGYYSSILHRPSLPSGAEVAAWAASGLDLRNIRIGFESSLEYFLDS
jgi:hypothetical protein